MKLATDSALVLVFINFLWAVYTRALVALQGINRSVDFVRCEIFVYYLTFKALFHIDIKFSGIISFKKMIAAGVGS